MGIKSVPRRSSPWWSFRYYRNMHENLSKHSWKMDSTPTLYDHLPTTYQYHQKTPSNRGSRHIPWTTARQSKHDNKSHPINRYLFSITTPSRWDSPSCIPNNSNRIFVMNPVFLFLSIPHFVSIGRLVGWLEWCLFHISAHGSFIKTEQSPLLLQFFSQTHCDKLRSLGICS